MIEVIKLSIPNKYITLEDNFVIFPVDANLSELIFVYKIYT